MSSLLLTCWMTTQWRTGRQCIQHTVSSKAPPLSLGFIRCRSLRISMVPLETFVVMPITKMKEFSAPGPVFWAGTVYLTHVIATTGINQHLIGWQYVPNLGEVLLHEHKAHYAPKWGISFFIGGFLSTYFQMAFCIKGFYPTAFPRQTCGSASSAWSPHCRLPQESFR